MEAFITLLTSDRYAPGALVLANALRDHNTTKRIAVLVTRDISPPVSTFLRRAFDDVIVVDAIDSGNDPNLQLLGRPELGITFTKLQIWKQTQYTKVVYLDADTLPLCNIDDLFEREELSACADAGWPDNFNSGVFVARPSTETFEALVNFASSDGSFDGADQGLLNAFFSNWSTSTSDHRIPFTYNATPNAVYSYRPAFHRYRKNIKVIHFIGADKPWFSPRPTSDAAADDGGYEGMVSKWWKVWRQSFGELAPANVLNYQQYQPSNGPQASNLTFGKFRNAWDVPTIRTPSVSGGVMEVLASNLGRTRLHSPHSRPTKGILRIESSIEKSERSRIKKQVSFENLTTLSVPPAETKRGEHSQPRNHHRTHLHFVEPRQNPQVSSDRLSIDPVISVGDRSSTSTPPPPTAIAHETIQQIQPHPLLSPRSPTPPVHEDLPRPPVYNPDEWGKSNVNPIFPWEIQASKGSAPATRVWQQDSHELAKAAKEKVKKGFRNAWDDLPLRIPHFSPPEQHLPVKEDIGQPVLKGSNRIDSMIREDVSTPLMTDDNDDYGFLPLKHQASSSVWPEVQQPKPVRNGASTLFGHHAEDMHSPSPTSMPMHDTTAFHSNFSQAPGWNPNQALASLQKDSQRLNNLNR